MPWQLRERQDEAPRHRQRRRRRRDASEPRREHQLRYEGVSVFSQQYMILFGFKSNSVYHEEIFGETAAVIGETAAVLGETATVFGETATVVSFAKQLHVR